MRLDATVVNEGGCITSFVSNNEYYSGNAKSKSENESETIP